MRTTRPLVLICGSKLSTETVTPAFYTEMVSLNILRLMRDVHSIRISLPPFVLDAILLSMRTQ